MKIITEKQKALVFLLSEMEKHGIKSKTFMEKALFLLKKEEHLDDIIKFYSFFPYKYGPFSFVSYDDVNKMKRCGYIDENRHVTAKGREMIKVVDRKTSFKITNVITRFRTENEIMDYVYSKYPAYTVKSKLKHSELEQTTPAIFTIGYEGKDIDAFLDTMISNKINLVIDIRYNPFSMSFNFIKNTLKNRLAKSGIEYMHMKSLGIEGELRKNLVSEKDYSRLFADYRKRITKTCQEEIEQIIKLGKEKRVALLCFENSSTMCHRGVVADEITKKGEKVAHL